MAPHANALLIWLRISPVSHENGHCAGSRSVDPHPGLMMASRHRGLIQTGKSTQAEIDLYFGVQGLVRMRLVRTIAPTTVSLDP